MKIKWVRTKEGNIFTNDTNHKIGTKYVSYYCTGHFGEPILIKEFIIKVADTPQVLIEVGDLIETDYGHFKVYGVDGEKIFTDRHLATRVYQNEITKIWTSNANGDYIKQWESE